ncbi:Cell differentiation protein rcd1 [Komagataella kurtzmanii]|nr:Cell differentiation protein rcd1 [Komagataella kurtzmanii]
MYPQRQVYNDPQVQSQLPQRGFGYPSNVVNSGLTSDTAPIQTTMAASLSAGPPGGISTNIPGGVPAGTPSGPPPGASVSSGGAPNTNKALNDEKVYAWILELAYGPNKEQALLELGKKRELYDDLALVLWHSFGVMTSLLEEIVAVYPLLSPPQLTTPISNRVCNALALLQCVASHPDTRNAFLNAHIPLFLYPFLNTSSKQRPFEYLKLTSLGVIGALVKNDSPEVVSFLLTTEIIPLCLKIMESSSELSKTVAIFIVQKILFDDSGLAYVCQTFERFSAVSNVLKSMVEQLVLQPAPRLLKHVVRCYLRLSDNVDAKKALKECLPEPLKDGTFSSVLVNDAATKRCLSQLLANVSQE